MDSTLSRIRSVTSELQQIQTHLTENSLADAAHAAYALLQDPASLEVLSGFKTAVDELRRFLWFYIDEMAKQKREESDMLLYSYRVKRAAEILRSLHEDASRFDERPRSAQATFLEQITAVVEGYVKPEKAES